MVILLKLGEELAGNPLVWLCFVKYKVWEIES